MLEVRVLGTVEVVDGGGGALSIGGPRQQRLVAALASRAGEVVAVDRLVEVVWPDDRGAPSEPRVALQTYVSRLRSAGIAIEHSGDGYIVGAGALELDAKRFETESYVAERHAERGDLAAAAATLGDALDRWRGPAFADFADEEWARAPAARLEEMRLLARERLAELTIERGEHRDSLPDLRALVAEYPLRETPRRLLMMALHLRGDQAEAVRDYHAYRDLLADETGLDPSAHLAELEKRILAADPDLGADREHRIGSYVLGEQIGEGAFGAIFKATQPSVGREVAIKVVRPELANDPAFVRRFEVEAQTVAGLEHPHVVPLYDYWRDPSGAYLVMRYLAAGSAEERLVRSGPFTLEEVATVIDEIGGALAVAHAHGVIHRDVKPANILFDEAGHSYLADFGIATAAVRGAAVDLRSAGSPLYAAPEQVRDGEVSTSSDIYACGIVIYELLSGDVPFSGSDSVQSLLERKLREPVPSVRDTRPDLPAGVELVIRTATSIDPADRFGDMGELILAFRSAAAGHVSGALTTDEAPGERPRQQASRTLMSIEMEVANPYKGLAAFGESDSSRFFGRTELTQELHAHLERSKLLVVAGPSGSGKSSVVRAGLVPGLRDESTLVASMVPGRHPFEELETALLRVSTGSSGALLEQLRDGPRGVARAIRTAIPEDDTELVLVIDQFEELFTLAGAEEAGDFLGALAEAITDERCPVRVVCTLRADFWDRPLQHAAISELVRVNTIAVTPLSGEQLEEAITRPAASVGVLAEPALVAAVISDVAGQAAPLPLVQYTLAELYERRSDGRMTVDGYEAIGGISGALASRADEVCESFDLDGAGAARQLFSRLVTPGEGTEDTRRRVLVPELPVAAAGVVDAFGAARLLTFDHDPISREPTVEVAHEALIREWPRLREWLNEDRDGLRIHRHLGVTAAAWVRAGRESGELYRGGRLEAAQAWVAEHGDDLNEQEREFLSASEALRTAEEFAERRRIRRLRTLLAVTAVVAAVALIAGLVAFQQRSDARDQRAVAVENAADAVREHDVSETRRLASEAGFRAAGDPQLGLLLAAEAHNRDPVAEGPGALQRALTSVGSYLGSYGAGRSFQKVELLGSDRVFAAGESGAAIYDLETGEELWSSAVAVGATILNFGEGTRTPRAVAAAGADTVVYSLAEDRTRIEVVRVSGRVPPLRLQLDGVAFAAAVTADGSIAAVLDSSGILTMVDELGGVRRVDAYPEQSVADFEYADDLLVEGFWTEYSVFDPTHEILALPAFAWSVDASIVTSAGGRLRAWDGADGELLWERQVSGLLKGLDDENRRANVPYQASLSADGTELIWVTLYWLNVQEGNQARSAGLPSVRYYESGQKILEIERAPDGSLVALLTNGLVTRLDEVSGEFVGQAVQTNLRLTTDIALTPDSRSVLVSSRDGIGRWSLDGATLLADPIPRNDPAIDWVSISRDGTRVNLSSRRHEFLEGYRGGMIELAEPTSTPTKFHEDEIYAFHDVVSDAIVAKRRVAPDPFFLQVTDPLTGVDLGPAIDTFAGWTGQALTRDRKLIAIGAATGVRVHEIATGIVVVELDDAGRHVGSLSFNADESLLGAANADGTAAIWRSDDWSLVADNHDLGDDVVARSGGAMIGRSWPTITTWGTTWWR